MPAQGSDHRLRVSRNTRGIVAKERTLVARTNVEDSEVSVLYSSANIVIITADGSAASDAVLKNLVQPLAMLATVLLFGVHGALAREAVLQLAEFDWTRKRVRLTGLIAIENVGARGP